VKAIYALYPSAEAAQQAVNRLRAAGIAARDITVISSHPIHDLEFGRMDAATWMWWIACAGGLVGMGTAVVLAWVTETSWPIDTGGLPIWAWWPNLIIMFELTMLGAIVATVLTLVVTAGLGRSGDKLYDPAVSDGRILVGVENPQPGAVVDLRNALAAQQGADIRTM
jgi:hypothetical protein